MLVALVVLAGLGGLVFGLRNVSRRPRRVAISRSWASLHLARLEALGRARGRPRAPSETTPAFVRALGTLAPDRREDLEEIGRVLDEAMFGDRPLDPATARMVDELVEAIGADWSQARNPADLVPV